MPLSLFLAHSPMGAWGRGGGGVRRGICDGWTTERTHWELSTFVFLAYGIAIVLE